MSDIGFSLDSIHYSQHNGWYTRQYGYKDERPSVDVYIGKMSHGFYHDSCCGKGCMSYCHGGCEYFHDFRNHKTHWKPHNVVPASVGIKEGGKHGHVLKGKIGINHCPKSQGNCRSSGCSKSYNNWKIYQ